MYTADHARSGNQDELDERIRRTVEEDSHGNSAYLRVYIDDWFVHSIKEELEKRGFKNVIVPDICLKGDVYFEW